MGNKNIRHMSTKLYNGIKFNSNRLGTVIRQLHSLKEDARRKLLPGSVAFVPSAAGLVIAGEVVKDLAGEGF